MQDDKHRTSIRPIVASLPGIFAAFVILVALPLPGIAHATPIYKRFDKHGQPIYSNRTSSSATPHELPEIMKETAKGASPASSGGPCLAHGGVSCQAGRDTDDSVICGDGSREDSALFAYVCPVAKLVIARLVQPKGSTTITVVLRNTRAVTAEAPQFRLLSPKAEPLDVKGPTTLGGNGIGVFEAYIPQGVLPGGSRSVTRNQLLVTCRNCG